MSTRIYHHPDIFLHDAEADHVAMESNRIAQVFERVSQVPGIELVEAAPATLAQIERNHDASFVWDLMNRTPRAAGEVYRIDRETILNRHTWRAMELSAGAVCQAVDAVIDGEATNAFCPVYAGHHAQYSQAGGFCFINMVAIGAHHALARGIERVAILDIDTHSGNGTALSFLQEPRVLFAETYQEGYPGSFLPGYCPPNIRRVRAKAPYQFWDGWNALLEEVAQFKPQLILVSAGFDAHFNDPLGLIKLSDADYVNITRKILDICPNVVANLEGGYHVSTTARCAALMVQEMLTR
jgi:acetoin utilization deacetylase AcuC-like enzyme